MRRIRRTHERRALVFGILYLLIPLGLSGCGAAIVGGILGGILASKDRTKHVPLEEAAITSVSPRQSAVVGGVRVRIVGQNFEPDSVVSFGGRRSPSVQFIDEHTLEAVVPFNDLNQTGDTEPDDSIYGQLGLRVSTKKHGVTDAPFWYLRPRVV